jgi:hypothetical protein
MQLKINIFTTSLPLLCVVHYLQLRLCYVVNRYANVHNHL